MSELITVSPLVVSAVKHLRLHLAELDNLAQKLCKGHLDFVIEINKKKNWDDKSLLYAQSRLRDNTLTVTWYEVRWYGSKALKTRRMVKKVIVKPKNKYGYTMATLMNKAQPWEADMVSEVESALIPIRRDVYFVAGALTSLNKLIGCAEKVEDAGDSE